MLLSACRNVNRFFLLPLPDSTLRLHQDGEARQVRSYFILYAPNARHSRRF